MAAGHAATQHRKERSSGGGDLAAPMTREIERELKHLIAKFGYDEVRDALAPLVAKCAFRDWLCVANAVDRLARKDRQRVS